MAKHNYNSSRVCFNCDGYNSFEPPLSIQVPLLYISSFHSNLQCSCCSPASMYVAVAAERHNVSQPGKSSAGWLDDGFNKQRNYNNNVGR